MYWKKKNDRFVRPVRWIVALLDDEIVPVKAFDDPGSEYIEGPRSLAGWHVTIDRAIAT